MIGILISKLIPVCKSEIDPDQNGILHLNGAFFSAQDCLCELFSSVEMLKPRNG